MYQIVKKRICHFFTSEDGPTSVEYSVMLAVILLAMIGAIMQTGEMQQVLWFDTATDLSNAINN